MSALQIAAVLGLLVAFGVPQVQVDTVQAILNKSQTTPMVQSVPAFGGVGAAVPQTAQYTEVGTTTNNYTVYQGATGSLFYIDPTTGCHKGVLNKRWNGAYMLGGGQTIFCPAKQ